MLAGVPTEDVTIDRQQRRALVNAKPLEGATLAAYRELEQRIDATEPEWDIRIVPPIRALPAIAFGEDDALAAEGRSALQLLIWAQRRIGIPVRLQGTQEQLDALRKPLADAGVSAEEAVVPTDSGSVEASWIIPES